MDKEAAQKAAGWFQEKEEEFLDTEHPDLLDAGDLIRPEKVNQKRDLWEKPWSRAILAAIPLGIILFLIVRLIGGNKPPSSAEQTAQYLNKSPTVQNNSTSTAGESIEDLKARLAIQQQQQALGQLNLKAKATPAPTPTAPPSAAPTPAPTTSATAVRPTTTPSASGAVSYPPQPVVRSQPQSTQPVVQTRVIREVVEKKVPVPMSAPSSRAPVPALPANIPPLPSSFPSPSPPVDPLTSWLAARDAGSYGNVAPNGSFTTTAADNSQSQNASYPGLSGGVGSTGPGQQSSTVASVPERASGVTVAPSPAPTALNASEPPTATNISSGSVVVGTRTLGRLETPIAWSGSTLANPNQNFLIKLTDSLKTTNGSDVLPSGSYLVTKVTSADGSGLLQMSATGVLVMENGQQVHKPLPEGAVLILAENGQPLRASAHSPSRFWSDVGLSLLGGASQAAAIVNQPTSQVFYGNSFGYSGSATSPRPNVLAGFGQGVAQTFLNQEMYRQQQATQNQQNQAPMFELRQGATVQVFVNQSFTL